MVFYFTILLISFVALAGCSTSQKVSVTTSPPTLEKSPSPTSPVAEKPSTSPEATRTSGPTAVTCVHDGDTRVLQRQMSGTGCNLNYTKYGKTASVVKSTSGSESCEKVEAKIRSKLESAGYDCK